MGTYLFLGHLIGDSTLGLSQHLSSKLHPSSPGYYSGQVCNEGLNQGTDAEVGVRAQTYISPKH